VDEQVNKNLKAEIIRKYGAQYPFAHDMGIREATVSAVIRGQRTLDEEEKKKWADTLGCKEEDNFTDN